MGPETFRISPLACYTQWTLETAIGNLGCEIQQDRDLFANLTQQAVLRSQVNSLRAHFPWIEFEVGGCSSWLAHQCEFNSGFVFLPRCEEHPLPLSEDELIAFKSYWGEQKWPNTNAWPNEVCCWAKLQLPSGQKARSVWYKSSVHTKLRRASCVKVIFFYVSLGILLLKGIMQIKQEGGTHIANVQFYFYIRFGNDRHPLAMVTMFSLPDADVYRDLNETVYLSELLSTRDGIVVIPVTAIHSVVSMFPETRITDDGRILETGKFSLMRHALHELAQFLNGELFEEEDEGCKITILRQ